MANSRQAKKRARQNEKRRLSNKWQKSRMYTYVKKVLASVQAGNKDQAETDYKAAVSFIDRMALRGLIHKNKADRHKSRLNKKIKALATS